MRLLAFLLLGTLIFGFAFPAAILIIGLFAVFLFIIMIIGLLRGGGFRVYTNKGYGPFEGSRKTHTQDDPQIIDVTESDNSYSCFDKRKDISQVVALDEEQEGEVVDLPATALRKEK